MGLSKQRTSIAHLAAAFGLVSPAWAQAIPANTEAPAVIPAPAGWVLTYDDEFNGTKVDPSIWKVADAPSDWMSYSTPDDVSVQDGYLRLCILRPVAALSLPATPAIP